MKPVKTLFLSLYDFENQNGKEEIKRTSPQPSSPKCSLVYGFPLWLIIWWRQKSLFIYWIFEVQGLDTGSKNDTIKPYTASKNDILKLPPSPPVAFQFPEVPPPVIWREHTCFVRVSETESKRYSIFVKVWYLFRLFRLSSLAFISGWRRVLIFLLPIYPFLPPCIIHSFPWGGGGGTSKSVMGMCRWIGSHFHNWINYKFNGVTFWYSY